MILVVGFHRSGTSLMAQTLRAMGFQFGPAMLELPADGLNPRGYGELLPVVQSHEELLRSYSASWKNPEVAPSGPSVTQALRRIIRPIEPAPAFVKDPRLCLFLSAWIPLASKIVYVFRDPRRAALSLENAQGVDYYAGLDLWKAYLDRSEILSKWALPTAFFEFERFCGDPSEIQRLAAFVGKPGWDIAGLEASRPTLIRTLPPFGSKSVPSAILSAWKALETLEAAQRWKFRLEERPIVDESDSRMDPPSPEKGSNLAGVDGLSVDAAKDLPSSPDGSAA